MYAFLDIHPSRPGHTLVVPKQQVDRLEDLSEEAYAGLMVAIKKIMQRLVAVFGQDYRACLKLEGFDVPHAHVHVIPCKNAADFWTKPDTTQEPDHKALAAMANKLAF